MQFSRDLAKTIRDKFRSSPAAPVGGQRRSRSTGDLEAPQYELIDPGTSNRQHIEPGEGLRAHPEDSDRVPVEFLPKSRGKDGARMRVLKPHSAAARETTLRGEDTEVPPEMLHLTQPWFYPNMGRTKGEGVLARLGLINGSYLVRGFSSHLALSVAHDGNVTHFLIQHYIDPVAKEIRYFIESDHAHTSVYSLVTYYRTHKGVLPCMLGSSASRVLYYRRCSEEGSRRHRLNAEKKSPKPPVNGMKGDAASPSTRSPRPSLV
ncbi:hypothetical protein PFISCL1PPCAC_10075 [Pristionchus fissidentatus]|uniref:SH2 domain-containing protein n=1 Tax=Pristionchus fissidentatus TaxID=1538716 RepID=A0AAV5VKF4_9BILA|nr:hypothetical protein PFISCL1PPCAC_10075 [Pristionchus fissidentatus]